MAAIRWAIAASLVLVLMPVAFASADVGADGEMAHGWLDPSQTGASGEAQSYQQYSLRRMLASLEVQSQCL